jgi:SH3-like domain-containing protein
MEALRGAVRTGFSMRSIVVVILAAVAMFFVGMTARPLANSQAPVRDIKRGPSGLPLPRYVSLKASRANLRVGPGTEYTVSWLYTRPGLPMEIIQEYDHWRHVRDAQGTEGWVYQSLLSGERTAEAAPWLEGRVSQTPTYVLMHKGPRKNSAVIAKLEPGVILRLSECNGEWCHAGVNGTDGWVEQADLWGAYPGEVFK